MIPCLAGWSLLSVIRFEVPCCGWFCLGRPIRLKQWRLVLEERDDHTLSACTRSWSIATLEERH